MSSTKHLERQAIQAYRSGTPWAAFWQQHGSDVAKVVPMDAGRYHRLVARLTALVAAGDVDGAEPVPNGWSEPCPWELDGMEQTT
jgi:hypothetical protein